MSILPLNTTGFVAVDRDDDQHVGVDRLVVFPQKVDVGTGVIENDSDKGLGLVVLEYEFSVQDLPAKVSALSYELHNPAYCTICT